MQELRFVLIIVGALAIAALLFHGLWTSRKDGKSKFGNKPLGKIESDDEPTSPPPRSFFNTKKDDVEEKKSRKEPAFTFDVPASPDADDSFTSREIDPLIDSYENHDDFADMSSEEAEARFQEALAQQPELTEPEVEAQTPISTPEVPAEPEPEEDPFEVLVLNVHCATSEPFVGTKLFDSMKQNGLLYGEMDIFHRHADLSGTGKILFSVANMMQPGTLKHDDPNEFTTKGISFFMTLPCFGDSEQNFKVMLRTAQQIADDMGGNVLDERRNLMTPDRLAQYRQQIKEFKAKNG
ncbi:cell division protein ZipA [Vibrio sp. WJH972]